MEYKVGDEILTLQGYWVTIVDIVKTNIKNSKFHYTVRFDNGFELTKVTDRAIETKKILYPFHPTVFGVGYLGIGKYSTTTKNGFISTSKGLSKAYAIWQGMLGRCYCPKVQARQTTYVGDTVHPYWHNYQNFAKWFDENYIDGFAISKIILTKKCTVYSEDTCCFVPMEISNAFIKRKTINKDLPIGVEKVGSGFSSAITTIRYTRNGIVTKSKFFGIFSCPEDAFIPYKQAKEKQLRMHAKFWKEKLHPKTHKALLRYKAEMDD